VYALADLLGKISANRVRKATALGLDPPAPRDAEAIPRKLVGWVTAVPTAGPIDEGGLVRAAAPAPRGCSCPAGGAHTTSVCAAMDSSGGGSACPSLMWVCRGETCAPAPQGIRSNIGLPTDSARVGRPDGRHQLAPEAFLFGLPATVAPGQRPGPPTLSHRSW